VQVGVACTGLPFISFGIHMILDSCFQISVPNSFFVSVAKHSSTSGTGEMYYLAEIDHKISIPCAT
jgi:hypothetical protein